MPEWRWRTFPVFFAFVSGMLLAFLVNEGTVNAPAAVLLIAALLGFGYGLAHLFVTNVVMAGRTRRGEGALARGEVPDDEFGDELVYRDEETADTRPQA